MHTTVRRGLLASATALLGVAATVTFARPAAATTTVPMKIDATALGLSSIVLVETSPTVHNLGHINAMPPSTVLGPCAATVLQPVERIVPSSGTPSRT
jgi:hypothetical protein